MKTTLTAFAILALVPAGAVLADDDECYVPRGQWQPREAAMEVAEQNGWTVRRIKIDDGCYEIKGRDTYGRKIEVKLDPATLQIVEMELKDDNSGSARNPAPAGTVEPPQNGLFENGILPQAQTN